jgi:hypothetical protein
VTKFDTNVRDQLKSYFEAGDKPTQEQWHALIQAIQDGIEGHEHKRGGGCDSGTGDAAPVGFPDQWHDSHLRNIRAWRRRLATRPDLAAEMVAKTWQDLAGHDGVRALASDGEHVYAGLQDWPARVVKIVPRTMATRSRWFGDQGEDVCCALAVGDSCLYAGLATSPMQVVKIAPDDMSTVSAWTGAETETDLRALTFDCLYLYVGLHTAPARVLKKIMRDLDE